MNEEQIRELSDNSALNILEVLAQAQKNQPATVSPSADMADALNNFLQTESNSDIELSGGESARYALELMADDTPHTDPVNAMVNGPSPERMGLEPVSGTLLAAGILIALQTHVKFERDKEGRWSLKLEKKPSRDGLIAPLLKKLLSLLPGD